MLKNPIGKMYNKTTTDVGLENTKVFDKNDALVSSKQTIVDTKNVVNKCFNSKNITDPGTANTYIKSFCESDRNSVTFLIKLKERFSTIIRDNFHSYSEKALLKKESTLQDNSLNTSNFPDPSITDSVADEFSSQSHPSIMVETQHFDPDRSAFEEIIEPEDGTFKDLVKNSDSEFVGTFWKSAIRPGLGEEKIGLSYEQIQRGLREYINAISGDLVELRHTKNVRGLIEFQNIHDIEVINTFIEKGYILLNHTNLTGYPNYAPNYFPPSNKSDLFGRVVCDWSNVIEKFHFFLSEDFVGANLYGSDDNREFEAILLEFLDTMGGIPAFTDNFVNIPEIDASCIDSPLKEFLGLDFSGQRYGSNRSNNSSGPQRIMHDWNDASSIKVPKHEQLVSDVEDSAFNENRNLWEFINPTPEESIDFKKGMVESSFPDFVLEKSTDANWGVDFLFNFHLNKNLKPRSNPSNKILEEFCNKSDEWKLKTLLEVIDEMKSSMPNMIKRGTLGDPEQLVYNSLMLNRDRIQELNRFISESSEVSPTVRIKLDEIGESINSVTRSLEQFGGGLANASIRIHERLNSGMNDSGIEKILNHEYLIDDFEIAQNNLKQFKENYHHSIEIFNDNFRTIDSILRESSPQLFKLLRTNLDFDYRAIRTLHDDICYRSSHVLRVFEEYYSWREDLARRSVPQPLSSNNFNNYAELAVNASETSGSVLSEFNSPEILENIKKFNQISREVKAYPSRDLDSLRTAFDESRVEDSPRSFVNLGINLERPGSLMPRNLGSVFEGETGLSLENRSYQFGTNKNLPGYLNYSDLSSHSYKFSTVDVGANLNTFVTSVLDKLAAHLFPRYSIDYKTTIMSEIKDEFSPVERILCSLSNEDKLELSQMLLSYKPTSSLYYETKGFIFDRPVLGFKLNPYSKSMDQFDIFKGLLLRDGGIYRGPLSDLPHFQPSPVPLSSPKATIFHPEYLETPSFLIGEEMPMYDPNSASTYVAGIFDEMSGIVNKVIDSRELTLFTTNKARFNCFVREVTENANSCKQLLNSENYFLNSLGTYKNLHTCEYADYSCRSLTQSPLSGKEFSEELQLFTEHRLGMYSFIEESNLFQQLVRGGRDVIRNTDLSKVYMVDSKYYESDYLLSDTIVDVLWSNYVMFDFAACNSLTALFLGNSYFIV